jgi:ABC-type Fe3+-siderophore transport system permease subunit
MGTRPAETGQFSVAAIIGIILAIYGAWKDGLDFNDLADPEVQGAITALVGLVAAGITWWIAHRQREGELQSAPDGTVQ